LFRRVEVLMNVIRVACVMSAFTVLVATGSLIANQANQKAENPKAEKAISLTGCLTATSQSGHQLAVMTTSATTPAVTTTTLYRLIAIPPAAEVKKHEDHRVTVTGWLTGPPPKGASASSKPQAVMEVRVKDILHVANSCK
jgi:nitrogen fixation protein FixH